MEKFEHIPLNLELKEIGKKLRLERTGDLEKVRTLFEIAKSLITAKAAYKISYIDEKLEDAVVVDQTLLKSRVLRKNLDNVGRVFPYVITIGGELEEKVDACKDILDQYYLDVIGNIALVKARTYLEDQLRTKYALDGISCMSPGSLEDWPIEEQRPLFAIIKGVETSIGVRLNKSLMMIPRKSLSGIFFPTEITFYSCQLCPRKRCEGRRVRYNEKMAREYGILK